MSVEMDHFDISITDRQAIEIISTVHNKCYNTSMSSIISANLKDMKFILHVQMSNHSDIKVCGHGLFEIQSIFIFDI